MLGAPADEGGNAMLRRMRDALPAAALGVLVLLVWEALIWLLDVSAFVIPAPSAIIRVLVLKQQALLDAAAVTAVEVLLGFLFSAVVGIAVALIIVRFQAFGRALYPLVVLFQTVPKVALAPIFILWFGYDLTPKVTLIVVIAFFPVALNMLVGLQSIDPALVALMRSVGAGRTEILRRVQIPNSLPYLISGLKIAITFSVIGALVGAIARASAGHRYNIQLLSP